MQTYERIHGKRGKAAMNRRLPLCILAAGIALNALALCAQAQDTPSAEQPVIDRVSVLGAYLIPEETILDHLDLKRGSRLDAAALRDPGAAEILDEITGFVGQFIDRAAPEQVCEWIDFGGSAPAPRFWVLDPIDGTKGFLRGEQYAVAMALVIDGQVELAVLACPNLAPDGRPVLAEGFVAVAARGAGAWARMLESEDPFVPLNVSDCDDAAGARLLRSRADEHTNAENIEKIVAAMGIQADPVRMDSQAKYGTLAGGHAELLVRLLSDDRPDYREKLWDQAPGSLILTEAGGRITDLDGNPLDFTQGRTLAANRGVLASNGKLHDAALDALKGIA